MSKKVFEQQQMPDPKKSSFDLGYEHKMSIAMGKLYPVFCQEYLPGDMFQVSTELLCRFAPMVAPIMHRVDVSVHFFDVPNRLVFDEWEDFITGGADGAAVTAGMPKFKVRKENFYKGSLPDYFGIPVTKPSDSITDDIYVNAMPFRAYQMIYNEFYRDQNVSPLVAFGIGGGDVASVSEEARLTTIRNRAWEKDYFTSALPWTQRGDNITMDMNLDYYNTSRAFMTNGDDFYHTVDQDYAVSMPFGPAVGDDVPLKETRNQRDIRIENLNAASFEITELRRAARLQEYLEKNARGGSRYIEQILSHFGVKSQDSRLQRPEYLGGGKTQLQVSEVLNTSSTPTEPQGNMSGHGLAVGKSNSFKKRFTEHGYVIGLISVKPRTAYMQGIPKHFLRDDKLDYFWPSFANLGEQEIDQAELYVDYNDSTIDRSAFGYQQRYAEYKYVNDMVSGEYRDTLDHWHLARKFTSSPTLSDSFVKCDPDDRIFAVSGDEQVYIQAYNDFKAVRPIPYFSNPKL